MEKKYFTIEEMVKSNTAQAKGIDNTPPKWVEQNLNQLIIAVLQPLRVWYGKPIYVTSGYRCEELNKAVGGAKYSGHLYGYAADITVNNAEENRKLFDYIINYLSFDKCIDEHNGQWVHVSFRKGNNRYEAMREYDGQYVYVTRYNR